MPRTVDMSEKLEVIKLVKEGCSQREIADRTGLSRPFIRKIAKQLAGHQFPRNGIEIKGQLCICFTCGEIFRRHPSKVAKNGATYCSNSCRALSERGAESSNWKGGKKANTFSQWIYGKADYAEWRAAVFARDEGRCQVTNLLCKEGEYDIHHLKDKMTHQELALDVDNGITLHREAHRLVHKFLREGANYLDAVEMAKKELGGVAHEV